MSKRIYISADYSSYDGMRYKTEPPKRNDLILLCTRLHENDSENINEIRIETVRQIRKVYQKRAIAGICDSPLARKLCPDLILPASTTKRNNYIKLMNEATICIATTGLKRSTGYRFAEYVAAGKAIVSEPLAYSIPGNFEEGKNYIAFNSQDSLLAFFDYMLSHPRITAAMGMENIHYYYHYLRPDVLILNALKELL